MWQYCVKDGVCKLAITFLSYLIDPISWYFLRVLVW